VTELLFEWKKIILNHMIKYIIVHYFDAYTFENENEMVVNVIDYRSRKNPFT